MNYRWTTEQMDRQITDTIIKIKFDTLHQINYMAEFIIGWLKIEL